MNEKYFIYSILFILNIGLSHSQGKKIKVKLDHDIMCVDEQYKMVFHDEFEGTSLDTNQWFTYYPYGPKTKPDSCSFCRTHTSANIYRDDNCLVGEGILRLKADREDGEWFGKSYEYTAGLINSKTYFTTFGMYEIRCRLPKGKQQWPAFWIFGWNTEIDIFEFICKGPKKPETSIHNWLTPTCPNRKRSEKGMPCYSNQTGIMNFGIDFSDAFHTWHVEYEPTLIKFYLDGIMFRFVPKYYDLKGNPITRCPIYAGEYLMDPAFPNDGEPVQVIAAQSICKKYKEKKVVFPNFMDVDFIRVYQKEIQHNLKEIKP